MLVEERIVSGKEHDFSPVMIRHGEGTQTIQMRWGLEPIAPGADPIILLRADGREFRAEERCLIPANILPLTAPDGQKWNVSLDEGGLFFCFAGIWRTESPAWAASYAVLTVLAYPDLAHIKPRHLAFMPKAHWAEWLAGAPAHRLLKPLPEGTLRVEKSRRKEATGDLFDFG